MFLFPRFEALGLVLLVTLLFGMATSFIYFLWFLFFAKLSYRLLVVE